MKVELCFLTLLALSSCRIGSSDKTPSTDAEDLPTALNTRTLILSHETREHPAITAAVENHEHYAKKHNYDYIFRTGLIDGGLFRDPGAKKGPLREGFYWQKITAVEDALELMDGNERKYEWVMWIDADALFTDMDKSIRILFKELNVTDEYFIVAKDLWTCINSGIFFVRNNEKGREFIQKVKNSHPRYSRVIFPDQVAIEDFVLGLADYEDGILKADPKIDRKKCQLPPIPQTKIAEQKDFNSLYHTDNYGARWRPGNYIAHFAGDSTRWETIPRLLECLKSTNYLYAKGCEDGGFRM